MSKKQAGSLGGRSTVRKYGKAYMAMLASLGARAFHRKYKLTPVGQNDFLIVDRESGEINSKTLMGLSPREYIKEE